MKNLKRLLKLFSLFNLVVFRCIAQENVIENKSQNQSLQFLVGYPLLNSIHFYKHSNFPSGNNHDVHSLNQPINFSVIYSRRLINKIGCSIELNYYFNKFKGPELRPYYNPGNTISDNRFYKMYQIFSFQELRVNLALSRDFNLKNKTYIRNSIGLGIHIFPFYNGKREFMVSNYYSDNQDTSIHYFKPAAKDKKAYRDERVLSSGVFFKSDYHFMPNTSFDICLGLYAKINSLPIDDQNFGSNLFEETLNPGKYEIAYGLHYQYQIGFHIGVLIYVKNN